MRRIVLIYDIPDYFTSSKDIMANIEETLDMAFDVTMIHNIDEGHVEQFIIRKQMKDDEQIKIQHNSIFRVEVKPVNGKEDRPSSIDSSDSSNPSTS